MDFCKVFVMELPTLVAMMGLSKGNGRGLRFEMFTGQVCGQQRKSLRCRKAML